jgi:hypothetical protein
MTLFYARFFPNVQTVPAAVDDGEGAPHNGKHTAGDGPIADVRSWRKKAGYLHFLRRGQFPRLHVSASGVYTSVRRFSRVSMAAEELLWPVR